MTDEDIGFGGMPPPEKEKEEKILAAGREMVAHIKERKRRNILMYSKHVRSKMLYSCNYCFRYMAPRQRAVFWNNYPHLPFMVCRTCLNMIGSNCNCYEPIINLNLGSVCQLIASKN